MKKINMGNLLRILSFLMLTFYLVFNGIHIQIGSFRLWIDGIIDAYKSTN
jgi:hypothetical protein